MTDYFKLGKKAITDAAKAELRKIEAANEVIFATQYQSCDIFQIALRRIGENDLASRFVDPNPKVRPLVERESHTEGILTGIISSLERGDVGFARQIEQSQRDTFYAEDIAYLHPHWRILMKPDTKQRLQEGIREHGIELGQHEIVHTYPREGRRKEKGSRIGCVSLHESILAVYGNLALEKIDHATKVITEIFNLYYDNDSGLFRLDYNLAGDPVYENWDRTVSTLRAFDLAGDKRGIRLFDENKIMSEFQRDLDDSRYDNNREYRLVALALGLDHFGRHESLAKVREVIAGSLRKSVTGQYENGLDFGSTGTRHNMMVCRLGLALTGLEKITNTFLHMLCLEFLLIWHFFFSEKMNKFIY